MGNAFAEDVEEEDSDDERARTVTYDQTACSSTAVVAPPYSTFVPGMGMTAQMGGYSMQQPWGMVPFMAYDPSWMQTDDKGEQAEQGMGYLLGEGPPLGMQHTFP